jgi:hypothetical protein
MLLEHVLIMLSVGFIDAAACGELPLPVTSRKVSQQVSMLFKQFNISFP